MAATGAVNMAFLVTVVMMIVAATGAVNVKMRHKAARPARAQRHGGGTQQTLFNPVGFLAHRGFYSGFGIAAPEKSANLLA
mgnify:CR=1 FL=1